MTSRRDKQKQQRSQLYRQIEETEQERDRVEKEKKLLLWKSSIYTDTAKLVFAGVLLGGIFEDVSRPYLVFGSGVCVFLLCLYMGYRFYKRGI